MQSRVWLRFAAISAVLILAALAVDRWAYEHLVHAGVYDEDWGRLLRVQGFWPLWLLVASALALQDWPKRLAGGTRAALRRGGLLLGSATVAGIVGEILKLLLRRERPRAHGGEYFFRPFDERTFSTGGLALPSSHTIVAFGAAFMLCRLFPRAAPIWILLAAGCGFTRVLVQAHFVSDIVVAAVAAWAVAAWLWHRQAKPRPALAANVAVRTVEQAETQVH